VGQQAVFKTSIQNGLSILRFDGVDDFYTFTRSSNIRTVYWVLKENALAGRVSEYRHLLGDTTNTPYFHRDGTGYMWSSRYGNPVVYNGATQLNGTSVNGQLTYPPFGAFGVVSLVTTGNATSDSLRDRTFTARVPYGDIGQILLYSSAHSSADVAAINTALKSKWGIV